MVFANKSHAMSATSMQQQEMETLVVANEGGKYHFVLTEVAAGTVNTRAGWERLSGHHGNAQPRTSQGNRINPCKRCLLITILTLKWVHSIALILQNPCLWQCVVKSAILYYEQNTSIIKPIITILLVK